jgi:ABC-type phosphate/phosphonate transport system substrate-binding protein
MVLLHSPRCHYLGRFVCLALIASALLAIPVGLVSARPDKVDVLHIGTSGNLSPAKDADKEKGNLATLQSFIKEETGLDNEIVRQKDWRELADKLSKKQLQVGAFQGYEFAWAKEKYADLKPLALAVNLYRYPIVYVVTNKDNAAKDFAGLQGQSLALPDTGQPYLRLFVEEQSKAKGKELKDFFSKITSEQSVEDALDDVVDGKVQAVVVDRAALEAYKQRKPGRFNKLKEVAKSEPLPPVVIAAFDNVLDDATQKRLKMGLLTATTKEKGKTMLTLFHLTGFDAVPDDFDKVLAQTRKAFPPPNGATK